MSWAFGWVRKASRTGLLRTSCLGSNSERERGDYIFKLEVGRTFTSRSTIHITYNADADCASRCAFVNHAVQNYLTNRFSALKQRRLLFTTSNILSVVRNAFSMLIFGAATGLEVGVDIAYQTDQATKTGFILNEPQRLISSHSHKNSRG